MSIVHGNRCIVRVKRGVDYPSKRHTSMLSSG